MKINSVTRNTMRNMITNIRLNSNVSSLSSVKPVNKLETSANGMSQNSAVLVKENFYDSIENKIKEEKQDKFQKNRENQRQNKRENQKSLYTVSEKDKETLDFLKSMINKFNTSIDNVKRIDFARNEINFYTIKSVIDSHSRFLSSIGITTDKFSHFHLNEQVFVKEIMQNPQKLTLLLEPQTGVIRKLCNSFGKMLI